MSNTSTKGKRQGEKDSPAAVPDKLEADGAVDAPSPLAAPAPSVPEATEKVAATEPTTRRYRVWSHGTLQRDGKVYAPGAELTLATDIAATIPCLEPA